MTTIHLVRHASAGARSASPSDIDRPLDDSGRSQAKQIGEFLADLSPSRLVSSPALRCRETLEPLAAAIGAEVEIDRALWEGGSATSALRIVRDLAAANVDAALCSHGDVIPAVLTALAASGVALHGSGCAKGSVWALGVADGTITHATYLGRP